MPVVHKTTTKNNKIDNIERAVAIFFTIVVILICYFSMRMV
jgi:hypothetical protein